MQSFRWEMMTGARRVHALLHQTAKIYFGFFASGLLVSGAAGTQDLLDCIRQAVGVAQHEAIEFLLLRLGQIAALESFQMQADGGNRRFEFVGNGVDKTILLFVALDLSQQKTRVDNESGDDEREKHDAKKQQHAFAPVENDPAYVECDGKRDQADAQAKKEDDSSAAAGDAHGWSCGFYSVSGCSRI